MCYIFLTCLGIFENSIAQSILTITYSRIVSSNHITHDKPLLYGNKKTPYIGE